MPKRFHKGGVFRAAVLRCIKRVGAQRWPKLLGNLRAPRHTELSQSHPAHQVNAWMGNSREVAEGHDLTVTDADFEDAAAGVEEKSGAESGAVGCRSGHSGAVT